MPDNTYNDYGTPLTRAEAYLAQIAQNTDGDGSAEGIGNTYNDYGTPLTRAEALLATIMENTAGGGGGGSGGGVLVVHIDEEYSALDKTWQEIHDALAQGTPCVTLYTEDDDNVMQGLIASVVTGGPPDLRVYTVHAITTQGDTVAGETWIATSRDGYPVYSA